MGNDLKYLLLRKLYKLFYEPYHLRDSWGFVQDLVNIDEFLSLEHMLYSDDKKSFELAKAIIEGMILKREP